jgi:hypothetical protein
MSYEPTSKRLVVTEITPTPESDSALEVTNAMGGGETLMVATLSILIYGALLTGCAVLERKLCG